MSSFSIHTACLHGSVADTELSLYSLSSVFTRVPPLRWISVAFVCPAQHDACCCLHSFLMVCCATKMTLEEHYCASTRKKDLITPASTHDVLLVFELQPEHDEMLGKGQTSHLT